MTGNSLSELMLFSIFVNFPFASKLCENSFFLSGCEASRRSQRTCSTDANPWHSCLLENCWRERLKMYSRICVGSILWGFLCFPSKFIKAARPPGLWVVDWLEILSVDKLSSGLNRVHACINTHFIKLWWWQRRVCLHQNGIFSLPGCLWCQLELVRSSWDAVE